MERPLRTLFALGLALVVGGCAASLPASPTTTTTGPGEGFTNSELRVALYLWSTDNEQIKNVCLKNSLVIFTFLQECGSPEKGEGGGDELSFQGCNRRKAGRTASFLVHPVGHQPQGITVGFDETAQQFTLATTPSATQKY